MATFIIYIIRWAVVLTMLYSLYGLFMKRETLHGFNRVVLLVILVASMALPLVQMETQRANIIAQGRERLEQQILQEEDAVRGNTAQWVAYAEKMQGANTSQATPSTAKHTPQPPSSKGWNWGATLLLAIAVYMVGLAVCWLRYLWQMAALLLMIGRSRRTEVEGVPQYMRVVVNPDVKAPCSWMRWIILNPADVGTRAIIRHEMAHVRYGHSFDMLLCELTCRMLWCVPFVWMLRQDLRDVHEFQADRRVLQSSIDEAEYQLLLIRKATTTGLQPVVNALNQSPIKRRFTMMYRKPSRQWAALKAAYLVPLSALALVAFARPQTMGEIEKKAETTETQVTQAIAATGVMKKVATLAENLGLNEPEAQPQLAEQETPTDSVITFGNAYIVLEDARVFPDGNLVKADLAESGATIVAKPKSVVELLDSTMLAVGARKIGDGVYVGHFQPNLNSDTVRIAQAIVRDRQSQPTAEHNFSQNTNHPNAYHITLNAETRKDRTGYYIRFLQPVSSTLRHYDQKRVDPMLLSTDSVLTKRGSLPSFYPVAIEQTKKETRIFMYVFLADRQSEHALSNEAAENPFKQLQWAICDEKTHDKYMFRSMDDTYFRYVKTTTERGDTNYIYQTCLVFPPLGKHVDKAHLVYYFDNDFRPSTGSFDVKQLPRKARIITN